MTDQKPNWAEAPADATHWSPGGVSEGVAPWRKQVRGQWMRWVSMNRDGQWRMLTHPKPETYIPRPGTEQPAPPTWDDQGLPPVGAQLEYERYKGVWVAAAVIGYDGEAVVVGAEETGYHARRLANLRAIPTPEQRAAAERREAIAAMLSDADVDPFESAREESMASALYDAGWRKTEGE